MAWIWNRFLPKAMRAETTPSARIHGYVAGKMQPDGPGLAMAVVKAGSVVHAAGYGLAETGGPPITAETIFHLASCGKQFTGLGIAMLAEEGKLDLDDPLAKHLPLLAAFGPQVTLRRLLHHTSGIRDLHDEDGIETNADIIRIYVDLGCPMAEDGGRPGDAFYYSNSGYDLLGAVIERVSGQSYHDFFQVRVFDPLDMKDTFSVPGRRSSMRDRIHPRRSGRLRRARQHRDRRGGGIGVVLHDGVRSLPLRPRLGNEQPPQRGRHAADLYQRPNQ
jgi:CubicO group peptidase (beta-lactamase class C family)